MCKVMIMTGIKHGDKAMDFMQASLPFMSKGNRDGVGYASVDGDGKLFAERWLNPDEAFIQSNSKNAKLLDELKDCLVMDNTQYTKHGDLNTLGMKSLIYHTRMATCAKNLDNVHPFINGNTALIHNGVIRNESQHPLRKEISTCDSEVILNSYIDNGVSINPFDIQATYDALSGYWACGVLSRDDNDKPILDVFRNDSNARLHVAYIEEIGAKVFCTDAEIIFKTLNVLGWNTDFHCLLIKPHVLQRFDAITGELLSTVKITETFKPTYNNNVVENKNFNQRVRHRSKKNETVQQTLTTLNDDLPTDSRYGDKYSIYRSEMNLYLAEADLDEKQVLWTMHKEELDAYLFEMVR